MVLKVWKGFVCWLLWLGLHGSVQAAGYESNPLAQALIQEMVVQHGFDRVQLEAIFAGVERQENILKAIARPAETKPWHEYRQIFVTAKRRDQGIEFYRRYAASLQRAEREYGVPVEIIVAIIGVETRYGRNKGSYRVIDALSTLAFDYPRRSPFFTRELKEYLLMTREQELPVTGLKGSYAGAMGYGQFIPSSYRAYAIDFDGDEVADILSNPVDAIGSVANYFARHGWKTGAAIVSPIEVDEGFRSDWMNQGLKPQRSAAEFVAAGIRPRGDFDPNARATAMEFAGSAGFEHWMGWHNFYVITRYNHSALYAMSVYQLSQEIAEQLR